jgi:predicted DNA binding protein
MREFVFDLVYEETPSPLQQLFEEPSGLSSTGVGGTIDDDEFWRVERFSGPPEALDQITDDALDGLLPTEGITADTCEGSLYVKMLKRTSSECEVYYHLQNVGNCESVGTLAAEYLGTDVLFEIERGPGRDTWTVMTESEDGIGLLYDAIQVSLRPAIRFEFGHVGQASDRRTALFARKNLPPEQREALVAAVKRGYYERPRQVTLDELSEMVDCPRSTLSYRLRSAESKLAKAFAVNEETTELESFPQTPEPENT